MAIEGPIEQSVEEQTDQPLLPRVDVERAAFSVEVAVQGQRLPKVKGAS